MRSPPPPWMGPITTTSPPGSGSSITTTPSCKSWWAGPGGPADLPGHPDLGGQGGPQTHLRPQGPALPRVRRHRRPGGHAGVRHGGLHLVLPPGHDAILVRVRHPRSRRPPWPSRRPILSPQKRSLPHETQQPLEGKRKSPSRSKPSRPKGHDFASVAIAVEKIAQLKPDFMSVTYGAGGGTSAYTTQIAQIVQGQGSPPWPT